MSNSGLNSGLGHDWTALDPAIVTGQLSHPDRDMSRDLLSGRDLGFGRADSPPNWITANLEQLTSEPLQPYGNSQASLIPAFNSLGLGARNGHSMRSAVSGQLGGWGGSTATPPPGFSQHRASQLQQHYPGFGLNKNSEAQKIGGIFTTYNDNLIKSCYTLFRLSLTMITRWETYQKPFQI